MSAEYLKEGEMVTEKTGGQRRKTAVRLDLLEPNFILAMAHILHIGAEKYNDKNWQKGLSGANGGINHAIKHLMEYQAGMPCDYGPRKVHLAQVAVNAMFEFFYEEQRERVEQINLPDASISLDEKVMFRQHQPCKEHNLVGCLPCGLIGNPEGKF